MREGAGVGLLVLALIAHLNVFAQIQIGGNVYGGGNSADVLGNTKVTVCKGELNKVFGGARMANVGCTTFVNIDGKESTGDIIITDVYGGNDIAGTIGQSDETTSVPTELENVLVIPEPTEEEITEAGSREKYIENYKKAHPKLNAIDNTWKTFVATSRSTKEVTTGEGESATTETKEDNWILIGSIYGGGNGNFVYTDDEGNPLTDESGNYIVNEVTTTDGITTTTTIATKSTPFTLPEIDKTYLELKGGELAHVYGGGNKATVRENTTINIDNESETCQGFVEKYVKQLILENADIGEGVAHTADNYTAYTINKLRTMAKLSTFQSNITSFEFNHARVFGGNNLAEMAIRPTWNLQQGVIRDLYSGGNRGNMTSPEGLLLEIDPAEKNTSSPYVYDADKNHSDLVVENVFGGCRMADVMPTVNGVYTPCPNLPGYYFPPQLSARVLVRGGTINNVYGGNDITGTVYGGNAVGVYTTINGDIYGGGNGAYAYTNQTSSKDHEDYGDFYYSSDEGSPLEALNAHRPNAEQVSIHLVGTSKDRPTIIKGSVFVGGNCASLATKMANPLVELKIGSHVIADKVFLGNNGEKMVDPDILSYYKNDDYNTLDLTNSSVFADYMLGAAMNLQPAVVFDNTSSGDHDNYIPYSSYVGSFYCGGNRGSMIIPSKNTYKIDQGLYVFNKFVGGCNDANVEELWTGPDKTGTQLCAAYEGGILGSAEEQGNYTDASGNIKDRLEINLKNLTIMPLRWRDESKTAIVWNTQKWCNYKAVDVGTTLTAGKTYYTSVAGTDEFTAEGTEVATGSNYYEALFDFVECDRDPSDTDIRLMGGNVYGGCYESGHVNGNVTININDDLLKKDEVFIKKENVSSSSDRTSGVQLDNQRDDVMSVAMTVFGAGCGEDTEIWGSTKVNLNQGYAFQIFGGGEEGVVGRKRDVKNEHGVVTDHEYYYDPAFSSTVNLNGNVNTIATANDDIVEDLAETEYIYGGGNEGDVWGNTCVNLGNGRLYDAFGGASNADIRGHSEVYIGRQPDGSGGYKDGFPWIRDIVYGGNDFGGTIHGEYADGYGFTSRVKDYDATKAALLHGVPTNGSPGVLRSASYVEYLQGRVDTIHGGSYGYYDYTLPMYNDDEGNNAEMPYLESSFVNIRPKANSSNALKGVFGAGTGYPKSRDGDKSQDRSYVLIDIPDGVGLFTNTEVFGAGSYNGLGMRFDVPATMEDSFNPDQLSAIIDLLGGDIHNAYGGSYHEGVTARTVVNVPSASTIQIDSIFGGAYGTQILPPCDVYESNVNYSNSGETASVRGAIFGGNNSERRTLYTHVNISSPVWSNKTKGYLARVYGAGRGVDTWSEYTEVNLNSGAKVYEVYGAGEMGHVLNAESILKYQQLYASKPSAQISHDDPNWSKAERWNGAVGSGTLKSEYQAAWAADWKDAWTLGGYYVPDATFTNYVDNPYTNLTNDALVTNLAAMDDRDFTGYSNAEKAKRQYRYNTNVRIKEGATVVNYAYGGGYGQAATAMSGDVYGTTYIALLGGTVTKDIYAAGTAGGVTDLFGVGAYNASTNPTGFTASANAYIKGGTCRNVYGGGWLGNVGHHSGSINATTVGDIDGETHVVIGDLSGTSFTNGIPAIQRNAYGGGEGGAVFGTAYLTLNKGYVGYSYNPSGSNNAATADFDERYEEKIEDDTQTTPNTLLTDAGCMFGGGYIDDSSVDKTRVTLYGGHVRGSVFGGGEIAAIGRGSMTRQTGGGKTIYELEGLYRPGKTNIEMYGGQVHRNVYGGGRGSDNLGGHGSLFCDGYVFGQTEVHIHGGEIGTVTGVADGNGNVFGGGDEGYVYSAFEEDGTFYKGVKKGERYKDDHQGYYFKHTWADSGEGSGFIMNGTENIFTEDCKVLIEPHMKVLTAVEINGHSYKVGDYVPIDDLNTLTNKESDYRWEYLDPTGIIIHNAVFAGGNTPAGSLTTSANTATVFGNATASVNDIYHRDMITLGTRHTGGLYGDGNLTLVDGYRELNITNYGTDYYSIAKEIGIEAYHALPDREADYYELRYTCLKDCKDKDGTQYRKKTTDENGFTTKASTITADEMQSLFVEEIEVTENGKTVKKKVSVKDGETDILILDTKTQEWIPNPDGGYWEESGVLPVYAGRLMNSIQRADFCGVFGSRMVMQGAQDRVPDEVDYTNYTINRVREVSLNKKNSAISGDASPFHGNYFGIYNIVNYLGALTSDVDFGDESSGTVRTTDNPDATTYKCDAGTGGKAYGTATYYDWKKAFHNERKRNNGSSHNKVALASGVYLELTTEESTGNGLYEKVWGPITGVIELDLINVSTGIGGGFVYAKNQHGVRSASGITTTTLTTLNEHAVTQWDFSYATADADRKEWETSGNFVHSTQTIIDDCYNISNKYLSADGVPAHYWYIKGSTYVYDQYISAYTGMPNAFSETVDIPLTIAAASHGRMKLLNVQPNLYAYYASPGVELTGDKKVVINDKTYYKNDPISYWDWYLLSKSEKELFVPKTFTNCITCKIDGVEYAAGSYVMTDQEFTTYKSSSHIYTNADNETIVDSDNTPVGADYIFRQSNNVGHDTGYILTYEVNNPGKWDNWFTPKSDSNGDKIMLAAYDELPAATSGSTLGKDAYYDGPTYCLDPDILEEGETGKLLGQHDYKVGELISKSVEDTYQAIANKPSSGQATFEQAYIVPAKITVTEGTVEHHYYPGAAVSYTIAHANSIDTDDNTAYICTNSVQLSKDEIIYKDTKMSKKEAFDYINAADGELKTQLEASLVPAYYCTAAGLYGGNFYEAGKNYRGLEAWSSMTADDHDKFLFNYDALDLLIDPAYSRAEGEKYQYDGNYASEDAVKDATTGNPAGYSVTQSVDYTASYNSDTDLDLGEGNEISVKRNGSSISTSVVEKDDELERDVFEALPNEKRHYAPIAVKSGEDTYYVVNTAFQIGSTPYAVGEVISSETYSSLPNDEKLCITKLKFATAPDADDTYYYCRETFTPSGTVTNIASSVIDGAGTGAAGSLGTVISSEQFAALPNDQQHFTIHGISPTETSTLFVSRESDIYDLSKEKIITVIYKYDYDETDASGNVTPISERHVLNIHLTFKSGVPLVEDISKPDIILPGDFTTLREPVVTSGAYEVTGGGWELFESESDAESHANGIDYTPNFDPLYWYQDGYYVAYYAKSYLGRTYSNHVPVSVANYHDLAEVMSDDNKLHHMYIDNKNVKRAPKIYINDYSGSGKNGLDQFRNLFDLSLRTSVATEGALNGHALLDDRVKAGQNLEFFLRTDIDYSVPSGLPAWTPVGTDDQCFMGTFHGDGHTVSNLGNSLFYNLCGEVYNLGVTGSFNSAGVVDKGSGYVESCWVKTTAETPQDTNTKPNAVFGAPSDTQGYQLVNSYFCSDNADLYNTTTTDGVTTSGGARGTARAMAASDFYNGTVAYDLNNFYLYKRYNDKQVNSGLAYKYWKAGQTEPQTAYYARNERLCSSGHTYEDDGNTYTLQYVEDRFADGDFRFAVGNTAGIDDERHWTETVTTGGTSEDVDCWYPVWPDDYIFFGQKLTYGYGAETHQDVPTAVVRDGGRLSTDDDANRVYRAPAYFGSKTMGVAHFNPQAYLAQSKKNDAATLAYPNMTAIDFAGHNSTNVATGTFYAGTAPGGSPAGFYPPLLDDDGLTGIVNCDETRNLLVYAPAATAETGYANAATHGVLTDYFADPAYADYYEYSDGYRLVHEKAGTVYGHLVQSDLRATADHFLVDKQDFNAPLAYTFDGSHRMWHQRWPADKEYVEPVWTADVRTTKGWQGISLPFTAELVTTQQKGEITHFYQGNTTGHEYWLRGFSAIKTEGDVAKADLVYPSATGTDKNYANTFLWDYYYENTLVHNQKDKNYDTYQTYYNTGHTYSGYPLLTTATPYIIGLPGKTYYEFDLSGQFEPKNTAADNDPMLSINKLDKQVVTFASAAAVTIGVSDDEIAAATAANTKSGYAFVPSYMKRTILAGTDAYTLNADGDSYDKVAGSGDATTVEAFRPYFLKTASGSRQDTRSIVFANSGGEQHLQQEDHSSSDDPGTITVGIGRHKILVSSSKRHAVTIRIVNTGGLTIATFDLKPGETVETRVSSSGVYMVESADERYVRKIVVR